MLEFLIFHVLIISIMLIQ